MPQTSLAQIKLANSALNPNRTYALYVTPTGNTLGLYRTDDFGENWIKCNIIDDKGLLESDVHGGLGWYANYVAVSPANIDHVAIGGFWSAMSFDGLNFYGLKEHVHADFHGAGWSKDGNTFAVATDGGVYVTEYKLPFNWNFSLTKIPTLQFGTVSVSKVNPNMILGGTQDNGIVYYDKQNQRWEYLLGDGGGVATHPTNENISYATLGTFGGGLLFRNKRNTNGNWADTNFGLPGSSEWFREVVTTYGNLPILITPIDNKIFFSINGGGFWLEYTANELTCKKILDITVTNELNAKVIFNCYGEDEFNAGYKIDISDLNAEIISYGLPIYLNSVNGKNFTYPLFYTSSAPGQAKYMYAIMLGTDARIKGKKIYRSEIDNLNWENITSNLPDVPYTSMLVSPYDDNFIIVGTDGLGLYNTVDGGRTWEVFDEGLPLGLTVTDMDYQIVHDSAFCVISTYGRGLFRKYIGGLRTSSYIPVKKAETLQCINLNSELLVCETSFSIKDFDNINIFDLQGRNNQAYIEQLSDTKFSVNISNLTTGMYFLISHNHEKYAPYKFIKR